MQILKKHRKRTGHSVHAAHLESLLSQPFCSVEATCGMAGRAEAYVTQVCV